MRNSVFSIDIVNEDETDIDFPVNPLLEKWDKLYPPMRYGKPCSAILGYFGNGRPIMNYSCVLCNEEKCRYSSNWKVPDEDKAVWDDYLRQVEEYNKIHNPKLYELLMNT